jgi:hypothetical protein
VLRIYKEFLCRKQYEWNNILNLLIKNSRVSEELCRRQKCIIERKEELIILHIHIQRVILQCVKIFGYVSSL